MTINAMWFDTETSDEAYKVNVGSVSVHYKQIYVGAIGTILTVPLIAVLNVMFRHRKMKVKVADDRLAVIKQNGFLPHWVGHIGWLVCLMTIIAGCVVTTLYSLQWGREKSNNWLMSVYFGALTDLTIGPLQVKYEKL